jgi:hypothetical protein
MAKAKNGREKTPAEIADDQPLRVAVSV